MQLQMIICLLTVGQGVLANALSLRPFPGPFNSSTVTFSHDLDPDHTPCRLVTIKPIVVCIVHATNIYL